MRRWMTVVAVLVSLMLVAPAALSVAQSPSDGTSATAEPSPDSAETGDDRSDEPAEQSVGPTEDESVLSEVAQIRLEVFCYSDSLDIPQAQAADACAELGEFGLTWDQFLEVFDGDGTVTDIAVPQLLPTSTAVDYQPDGAWRGSDPALPDGWAVIECPFLGDDGDDVTNGVGQVLEAEALSYVDRRHVVCYRFSGGDAPTTDDGIPLPSRIDTGGGGTAG